MDKRQLHDYYHPSTPVWVPNDARAPMVRGFDSAMAVAAPAIRAAIAHGSEAALAMLERRARVLHRAVCRAEEHLDRLLVQDPPASATALERAYAAIVRADKRRATILPGLTRMLGEYSPIPGAIEAGRARLAAHNRDAAIMRRGVDSDKDSATRQAWGHGKGYSGSARAANANPDSSCYTDEGGIRVATTERDAYRYSRALLSRQGARDSLGRVSRPCSAQYAQVVNDSVDMWIPTLTRRERGDDTRGMRPPAITPRVIQLARLQPDAGSLEIEAPSGYAAPDAGAARVHPRKSGARTRRAGKGRRR